jgi:hypothetical protein
MKLILFFAYLTGYILEVAGPIFGDPLLTSSVNGARSYSFAPLTIPILIALAIAECIVLRKAKNIVDLYRSLIPYSVAFVLTLPIFIPGFPHPNVCFVYLCCMFLAAATMTLQHKLEKICLKDPQSHHTNGNAIVYLKEAMSTLNQVMITILTVFAGFAIAFYSEMIVMNRATVTAPKDVWLMSMYSGFQIGWISLFFMVGPFFCVFQITMKLLGQMKQIAEKGSPQDVTKPCEETLPE